MFKCNENIKTYKFPVIKIILCSLLIVLFISRNYLIHINNYFWNVIISILCFLAIILLILCIYLSIGEMILLSERREETKMDIESAIKSSKRYSVDYILSLLETNDIIEILIFSNNQVVKLGASSDSRPGSSQFFEKTYYINNRNNISIKDLEEKLYIYSINEKVCVIRIDGLPPNGCQSL